MKVVQGYEIFFPFRSSNEKEEHILVDQEIEKILENQAIKLAQPSKDQFLSTPVLVAKKDTGHCPVINLKKLDWYIPYEHFKMEGLFLLKEILQKNDYMGKIDLKDAYFAVPLLSSSQKYIRLKWKGNLYQFLCLCFGLSSAPRVFTKHGDPNFGHAEIECETDNISRRYFDNGINKKRNLFKRGTL